MDRSASLPLAYDRHVDRYLTRRSHRARLVRDTLRARILDGRYQSNILPSEDALASEFDVGRNVMREALAILVQERLLRRAQGVGTQPTSHVVVHELNTLRAIAEEGGHPEAATVSYRHLTWDELQAPAAIALEFRDHQPSNGNDSSTHPLVILWERLTLAPEPIVLWTSYLPHWLHLTHPGVITPSVGGGTFTYFEQHGIHIGHAQVRTGASSADEAVAELLQIPVGDPVLVQHRRTWDRDAHLIEIATGYYRHDRMYLLNDYQRPLPNPGSPAVR